ncbi:MAG TPA: phosphohistidine phosphatase SixA [Candidatus Acidoferrum sp.]|nr:phosphohistidine phosphatase SixA [Candidatus Acidoferrum sp.]
MLCYFLRHGPAGDATTWEGSDFERPLTQDGIKRIAREAKTIAALEPELDLIITSPLVRARQTAEIVADELKLRNKLRQDDRLGLGFSAARLAEILRECENASALMLVGHEPSMSGTVGELIGGGEVDFKKGALACVEVTRESPLRGVLLWLASPKLLTR